MTRSILRSGSAGASVSGGILQSLATIWTVIAMVLASFKILRPLDEHAVEVPVEPRFSNGITVCRIVPRFEGMDTEALARLIAASTT
ncbi:hypothetical protein EV363DRAFT_291218 [Boletus edulis]|uniref:Uncharacterized protein n=1 Tax=Boletus edulis BED1 TaxID=1328754 RepID=A0AAD4GDB7_BOLED|nr:hypothetical protein EV363DRAFT_291218 [Boletus edulis]KAF8415230.1 hypothetical protein L210DRAFT_2745879 [Boletus edulis BED1]KAF8436611.1 hypothetical protein L210DRAFT_2461885 [Boletus edulis BED1]